MLAKMKNLKRSRKPSASVLAAKTAPTMKEKVVRNGHTAFECKSVR